MYDRLNEVKRQHESANLHRRDIDWLIEQAEKVKKVEYEIDNSDMGTAIDNIIKTVKGYR